MSHYFHQALSGKPDERDFTRDSAGQTQPEPHSNTARTIFVSRRLTTVQPAARELSISVLGDICVCVCVAAAAAQHHDQHHMLLIECTARRSNYDGNRLHLQEDADGLTNNNLKKRHSTSILVFHLASHTQSKTNNIFTHKVQCTQFAMLVKMCVTRQWMMCCFSVF